MGTTADINLGRFNVKGVDRFRVSITRDGSPWDLTGGTVTFTFMAPDRMTAFTRNAVIENAQGGLCYVDTTVSDFLVPGWWDLAVTVTDVSGIVKTYPFSIGFRVDSQPY
jgi:hypothetical protein